MTFGATYLSQFSPAGQFGQRATATLAHIYFRAKTKPKVLLFAKADYDKTAPSFSGVTEGDSTSSEWDVGLWDVAVWDGVSDQNRYAFRQNVRASGDMLAVGCVIVSGGTIRLDVEVDLATLQVSVGEASA